MPPNRAPPDRADAADDRQQDDGQADQELEDVGAHRVELGPVEGPAEAGDAGRQGEHLELGVREVEAQRDAGGVAGLHGQQPPTELATPQRDQEGRHEAERDPEQDQVGPVVVEREPRWPQIEAGHAQVVVGHHQALVEEHGVEDHREGGGGQRQVEAAQPQGGQGHEGADRGADDHRQHQAPQGAVAAELAHHDRADAGEGHGGQRDLAGPAGERDERQHDDAERQALAQLEACAGPGTRWPTTKAQRAEDAGADEPPPRPAAGG